ARARAPRADFRARRARWPDTRERVLGALGCQADPLPQGLLDQPGEADAGAIGPGMTRLDELGREPEADLSARIWHVHTVVRQRPAAAQKGGFGGSAAAWRQAWNCRHCQSADTAGSHSVAGAPPSREGLGRGRAPAAPP